ncbi:DEAD/DEAH box helicase [Bacillota bacterium LX-D]|nr:DEAD/DEAH box helicase [Bacillota bacterium LX-D]
MPTFYELGLSHPVVRATLKMGFEETTPIQEKTIPLALTGADVIGQAQTGTGKTAAFGIPLVEKIDKDLGNVQGMVITPTRELATQVAEELNKLGQFKGVRAVPIYGGQDIRYQIKALKNKAQIIVGTPGRLLDHLKRRTIRLQHLSLVVLDEADEMLNMGFIEDIENILKEVPEEHQTLLFSATMPELIRKLAEKFMHNPHFINIKNKELTVPDTEQIYIEVQEKQKFDVLCRLIDIQSPELTIIFGRTKRRVDEIYEALNIRGYSAEGLHGDLTQAKRNSVLRHFKEGITEILVATDVAARGLDISGVTHVYNYDIPQDPESYVHRIGRTGRAGKHGIATTFVTPREIGQLKQIEQVIKRKIARKPIPTLLEAIEGQQRLTIEKLMETVEQGDTLQYKELAEELLEEIDSVALLSAALKLLTKQPDTTPVKITEEKPFVPKKSKGKSYRKPKFKSEGRNDKKYSKRK